MNFYKDIIKEYPYKTELHCHTSNISSCSQIGINEMINTYKFEGYSGLVLTNHFYAWEHKGKAEYAKYVDAYIKEYHDLAEKGESMGVKVYFGMEIRVEENANDYLVYGIDEDLVRKALSPKIKTLKELVGAIKRDDNLIIQAHPFRNGMTLMSRQLLDGIEVYNLHPNHNSRVGIAAKYAEETGGVCTCGTDFHHQGQGCLTALLTREVPKDSAQLLSCIKNEPIYKVGNSIITF